MVKHTLLDAALNFKCRKQRVIMFRLCLIFVLLYIFQHGPINGLMISRTLDSLMRNAGFRAILKGILDAEVWYAV